MDEKVQNKEKGEVDLWGENRKKIWSKRMEEGEKGGDFVGWVCFSTPIRFPRRVRWTHYIRSDFVQYTSMVQRLFFSGAMSLRMLQKKWKVYSVDIGICRVSGFMWHHCHRAGVTTGLVCYCWCLYACLSLLICFVSVCTPLPGQLQLYIWASWPTLEVVFFAIAVTVTSYMRLFKINTTPSLHPA